MNNELVAKKDSDGTRTYFHNDHLGSTTVITDASGSPLAENTKYDPWGEVKSGGVKSKFQYTGQERDSETGLHYYNARYYDPYIRRFTQPDDIIQNVYSPQGLNRYSYVWNNPLKYTDPSGHINILNYNNALTQLQKKLSPQTYNNYLNTLNTFASTPGNTATPKSSASESIQTSSTGNISKGYWPQYDTGGVRDVFKPVYDFMLGNDIKTLKSPHSSLTQKGMAGVGIMGTFAPPLKGVTGAKFADKLLDTSKIFNPDQAALIDLAKDAKRANIGADEAKVLVEWAKEVGLPFHDIMTHPNRKFGQFPHINIGPVKHIFIN